MSVSKTKPAESRRTPTASADAGAAKPKPADSQAAAPPARRPGLLNKAAAVLAAAVVAYKTFAQRSIGTSYAAYPALIDECLERCLVPMRVITGTGNQVLTDVTGADTILAPSIVGVDTTTAGTSYQVSVVHNTEADTWTVSASPGITWSVLVLYQQGKR